MPVLQIKLQTSPKSRTYLTGLCRRYSLLGNRCRNRGCRELEAELRRSASRTSQRKRSARRLGWRAQQLGWRAQQHHESELSLPATTAGPYGAAVGRQAQHSNNQKDACEDAGVATSSTKHAVMPAASNHGQHLHAQCQQDMRHITRYLRSGHEACANANHVILAGSNSWSCMQSGNAL
jgi:septum formation inhibitor MinC